MTFAVRPYTITANAGRLIAGRKHGPAGSDIELTAEEAAYELLQGAILDPTAPPPAPVSVPAIAATDVVELEVAGFPVRHTISQLADFIFGLDDEIGGVLAEALAGKASTAALEALAAIAASKAAPADITAAIASLTRASVGLDRVQNLSPADMPVSAAAQVAIATGLASRATMVDITAAIAALTKASVGLDNVANLSPAQMPVSTAQAAAIAAAVDAGLARLTTGSPAELDTFVEAYNRFLADENAAATMNATLAALSAALSTHTAAANPHGVTKGQIGLGNVANLAPLDLPVSSATSAAIAQAVSDFHRKDIASLTFDDVTNVLTIRLSDNTTQDFGPIVPVDQFAVVDDTKPSSYLVGDADNGQTIFFNRQAADCAIKFSAALKHRRAGVIVRPDTCSANLPFDFSGATIKTNPSGGTAIAAPFGTNTFTAISWMAFNPTNGPSSAVIYIEGSTD